jgi:kinesin family protein 15
VQEGEQRKDENLKYLIKCSFLEIYGEEITDLLEPASTNLLVLLPFGSKYEFL